MKHCKLKALYFLSTGWVISKLIKWWQTTKNIGCCFPLPKSSLCVQTVHGLSFCLRAPLPTQTVAHRPLLHNSQYTTCILWLYISRSTLQHEDKITTFIRNYKINSESKTKEKRTKKKSKNKPKYSKKEEFLTRPKRAERCATPTPL